ncbi:unnamed protein product, partial [Trichogramma brassicae]
MARARQLSHVPAHNTLRHSNHHRLERTGQAARTRAGVMRAVLRRQQTQRIVLRT